jgi:beta-glucosidase
MDGDEVSQVYVKLPDLNIPMPYKQLKGFKRINIKHGKTQLIMIEIDKAQLRYWDDKDSKFITPKGSFSIMVGASSADIRLKGSVTIQ